MSNDTFDDIPRSLSKQSVKRATEIEAEKARPKTIAPIPPHEAARAIGRRNLETLDPERRARRIDEQTK